jgi:hypothetical protein
VQLLCRSHGVARSGPTHTFWLSDYTVWIHLLSKAGELVCRSHVLLGQEQLTLSGYLNTRCGYTYSVRLVQLFCRSHVLLGQEQLTLSGYLSTRCGYTYSVRLVRLLCRFHGVARSGPTHTLWLSDYSVRLVQLPCRSHGVGVGARWHLLKFIYQMALAYPPPRGLNSWLLLVSTVKKQ